MNKTLRISFSLRNTYRVNGILFSLKQIPLLKKLLPAMLYQVRGLKVFANVLSVLWEFIATFLGRILYFVTMVCGIAFLYRKLPQEQVFLHILFFLTVIGSFGNIGLFNPSKDKYYAMFLLKMDAREYTLVNYGYEMCKVVAGFLPASVFFGMRKNLPLWLCVLLPFCIAGMKLFATAVLLWDYERSGFVYNESRLSKYAWGAIGLLLAVAYGLPAFGFALPSHMLRVLLLLCIPLGALGFWKVFSFTEYRAMNQQLLASLTNQMDTTAQIVKKANENAISTDMEITSKRKGFEYLNELFVKRHKKILWNSTRRISYICLFLVLGVQLFLAVQPEMKAKVNEMVMTWLPYFVFIMYAINRGTNFTQALFMNCDHSLLTYAFFKQPDFVLKLFQIRLREIMKINAVPAVVIGGGLALTLYTSGGTDTWINYVILLVSILCMSMFFSVHYLTVYYLLQPYNAGTEMKSGTYRIVLSATYLICFFVMQQRIPLLLFGIMTIVFVGIYCVAASLLVYRLAPKTFKIRT